MRHRYTNRIVAVLTMTLVVATAVFATVALYGPGTPDRVGIVLAIDPDPGNGQGLYLNETSPSCANCHTLAAAEARSERAVDLDQIRPTRREVVVSLIGGRIGAHVAQDYAGQLSDDQIAGLAAYIERVAGR